MARTCALILTVLLAGCGGGKSGSEQAKAGGDPLAESAWELLALAEDPVLVDAPVTLTFSEGRIGGNAGCNQYFASYSVKGDSLRLGPAGATKKLCPEPIMAQEDRFLAFLGEVSTFRLRDGQLLIFRPDGAALVFTPAAAGQTED
jgi:heat shock protein HslJ